MTGNSHSAGEHAAMCRYSKTGELAESFGLPSESHVFTWFDHKRVSRLVERVVYLTRSLRPEPNQVSDIPE